MNPKGPAAFKGARIASVGTASPGFEIGQAEAGEFILTHYRERLSPRSASLVRKVFSHPGVRRRRFAFEDPACLLREDPDERVRRFTEKSVELSSLAALRAVEGAGIAMDSVAALVVSTCTGYICPGVSTYMIERLGLPPGTRAYDLVGSGCGGAIPNLQLAGSLAQGGEGAVLSVAVEICSATFQMGDDLSLIVSNALFADGAAAAVVSAAPGGLEMVSSASRFVPSERDAIRYIHKGGQLHNQLSTLLPRFVRQAVGAVVGDLLGPMSLAPADIRHWALHNGGEKIINAVRDELGLSEGQVAPSRRVLAEYGNMSSPTVWFVLRDILDSGAVRDGDWVIMVAFGAGLSAHAMLLRKTGA
ncbi:MAG: type III polyketide synthase [Thermodesulfovibrionales bacterium]